MASCWQHTFAREAIDGADAHGCTTPVGASVKRERGLKNWHAVIKTTNAFVGVHIHRYAAARHRGRKSLRDGRCVAGWREAILGTLRPPNSLFDVDEVGHWLDVDVRAILRSKVSNQRASYWVPVRVQGAKHCYVACLLRVAAIANDVNAVWHDYAILELLFPNDCPSVAYVTGP
jgi:hypothetical protein